MHRECICPGQSACKLHRLSRREVMAQASAWGFVSHVEQKQFDLICNSSFCHNKRSWIVRLNCQGHIVQGSEQVRCRGSFRRADSQHMLLVYTCPGLTEREKWFVFNIHYNILFLFKHRNPSAMFQSTCLPLGFCLRIAYTVLASHQLNLITAPRQWTIHGRESSNYEKQSLIDFKK